MVNDARRKLADAIRERGDPVQPDEHNASPESDDDGGDSNGRTGECRRRLRSALELHHRAVFFCANAYYQIRENADMTVPESEEYRRLKQLEDNGYETAKAVRKEILR